MRGASDLYVHPNLTDSEVWDKDAYNRSGTKRVLASVGVVSVVTLSTVAAGLHYTGVVDLASSALQMPHIMQVLHGAS